MSQIHLLLVFLPPYLRGITDLAVYYNKSPEQNHEIEHMLLFEKLLLAIAVLMQICNILVKDRSLIKMETSPILLETYLNFMGADLAPTRKL